MSYQDDESQFESPKFGMLHIITVLELFILMEKR